MKIALTIGILLLVLGYSVAQEATQHCPASGTLAIDGVADEWTMTWVQDNDKIFSYNVCADDDNLYVRVKTRDFYAKRKIVAFGFTLWIDVNGKKKKNLGLRFPIGGTEAEERLVKIRDQGTPGNSLGERADYQKVVDQIMIKDLEIMELIGLADDPITSTRSGITNGIKVAIGMDTGGAYVYEALIPFKSYRLSREALSKIGVGFETGRFVPPKVKNKTKGGDIIDYPTTSEMSRMQGYGGVIGNPKLSYATSAWTTLQLK